MAVLSKHWVQASKEGIVCVHVYTLKPRSYNKRDNRSSVAITMENNMVLGCLDNREL